MRSDSPGAEALYDVIVFAASAGGEAALISVLRQLGPDFDVPIVLMQHLPHGSAWVDAYAKHIPFALQWADASSALAPGTVLVCPPRSTVELLPDGSLRLAPSGGALDKPMDQLLRSLARSFAHRAIAVVLTGLGDDAARGALELHDAGGRVLVQSAASAQYPDMPRAAVRAGAADFVVALADIAPVLRELVAGSSRPTAPSELDAIARVFGGSGELASAAQQVDWSSSAVGPVLEWPPQLGFLLRAMLDAPEPSGIAWGPELAQFYNEAWRDFFGASKRPHTLGQSARDSWPEAGDTCRPLLERVLSHGVAERSDDLRLTIERQGAVEEVFVRFSFAPLRDARGQVVGVQYGAAESTSRVLAQRRLDALRELAARLTSASTPLQVCEQAASALTGHPLDVPFALLYLFDGARKQATLAAAVGLTPGSPSAPRTLLVDSEHAVWPLHGARAGDRDGELIDDLLDRLPELALPSSRAPRQALMLPLRPALDQPPVGTFIAGVCPERPLDEAYRNFLTLVAHQINTGVVQARARLVERERSERLAELDRTKTEFFANVSHEFRTPLTLLLTPLEEMMQRRDQLPPALAGQIDAAARNSRRLLRLVNNLLDFSEIETRRQRAPLELTDLGELTQDVSSAFRSAIERVGLRFDVHCEASLPRVPINREMWEKVVANLLSNALKFTFEGSIEVKLRKLSLHAELEIADTGIGIPAEELPNIFKRFHRVRGAKARTVEGSGMGLSIVHDLVARMGGQLRVRSSEGRGTTFTIWMPLKTVRKEPEVEPVRALAASEPRIASDLANEAAAWMQPEANGAALEDPLGLPDSRHLRPLASGARVLVADDNADMRDYLRRLLGAYWHVSVAADGEAALALAREQRPDLVLADVMMPRMDGFELLRAIRADEWLRNTPLVFLTARAGEDTAVEGLLAGADDYLAKPFSARELIARVGGQLELSRTRKRAAELNAFLVRFSDAVRSSTDPVEVARTACRMIHGQLGVDRAYWAEVDAARREFVIMGASHTPGAFVIEGRFPMDAWEPFSTPDRERLSHVVDDTQTDRRISEGMRAGYAQIAIGADLASPVFVERELRCVLAVNQRAPRVWTSEEIALVESVAVRCWGEVERARAEAALRESETKYRSLFESIDEGFCVIEIVEHAGEPVSYRFLEVNQAFMRHTGIPDPTGKLASEVAPGMEAHWLLEYDAVARTGEAARFEHYNEDTRHWYEVYAARVGGVASRQLAIVFNDVTERKEREERQAFLLRFSDALRAETDEQSIKQRTIELVAEQLAPDRAYISEVFQAQGYSTVGPERVRAGLAPMEGVYQLTDYPETMRRLSTETMVVHDAQTDLRFSDAEKALLAGLPQRALLVAALRRGERKVIWALVVAMAEPRRWTERERLLMEETAERAWDAIERLRAEAAMRASEAKYRALFDAIDDGFAVFDMIYDEAGDPIDFRYIETNPAFERQAGRRPEPGQTMYELFPEAQDMWLNEYAEVARTGLAKRFVDYNVGLDRWFEVFVFPAPSGHGRLAAIFSDVTEQKRSEATLRASEAHNKVLLRLSDAIRSLGDAEQVKIAASEVLGTELGVTRALYAEVEGDHWIVGHRYERNVVSADAGRYPMARFGDWIIALLRAGETLVFEDAHADERFSASERHAHDGLQIRAAVAVPLVKDGVLVAISVVHQSVPRSWTPAEIHLVEEFGERTWAAVERARAEAALRAQLARS